MRAIADASQDTFFPLQLGIILVEIFARGANEVVFIANGVSLTLNENVLLSRGLGMRFGVNRPGTLFAPMRLLQVARYATDVSESREAIRDELLRDVPASALVPTPDPDLTFSPP